MNKLVLFLSLNCTVAFLTLSANAGTKIDSIESCVHLLPAGHTFTMSINGVIDTTSENRELKVKLDLSDETSAENPEIREAAKPFLNCAMPLIKSGVKPL